MVPENRSTSTPKTRTAVPEQLRRLRGVRGVSQRALSDRLSAIGHPIAASAVAKIETGDRGVSVDDLLALAVVLNVSPARLMLPDHAGDDQVALAPAVFAPAWAVWGWAEGRHPLPTTTDGMNTDQEIEDYLSERPAELRRQEQHSAVRAAHDLAFSIRRVLFHAGRKPRTKAYRTTMTNARRNVERVAAELDDLEASDGAR